MEMKTLEMIKFDEIKDALLKRDFEYSVDFNKVSKNNKELNGITVKVVDSNICPTIYFDVDEDVEDIVDRIISAVHTNHTFSFNPQELTKERILSNAMPYIIGSANNEKVFFDKPHFFVEDMVVLFRYIISDNEDNLASFVISNDLANKFDVSLNELKENAFNHIELSCMTITEKLFGMGVELEEYCPLWIATNRDTHYGAAVIADEHLLNQILDKMNLDEMYILPSSIHEILCVDTKYGNVSDLHTMVLEVNASEVIPEEKLTDSVYCFKRNGKLDRVA